jgi:hypothetical protein
MRKLGYNGFDPEIGRRGRWRVLQQPEVEYEKLGEWCRRLLPPKPLYISIWKWGQYLLEISRLVLCAGRFRAAWLIERFFYDRLYFDWVRDGNPDKIVKNSMVENGGIKKWI